MIWERLMVDTKRGTFEVFTTGTGEPMCVTHLYSEFNETGDYFADTFVQDRQVFLVNLREAGNSPKANYDEELSMRSAVEDLEAIRCALKFHSWDFAGHSTGGMMSLAYAVKKEKSLKSLVLVGASASREYSWSQECIYHPDHPQFNRMQELIEQLKSPSLSQHERTALTQERTKLSLHSPDKYAEYFSGKSTKRIAVKRLNYYGTNDYPEFDLRSQLPLVTVPTLIMCGRYDVQCPVWCSVELHQLIKNSKLVVFEQSNHYPFLEEKNSFIEVVHSFLKTS